MSPGMQEPSLRTSRLVIAGGLVAAIALTAGGFLVGRATSPVSVQPDPAPTTAPVPAAPPAERPRVLKRADIIAAANRAADAYAAGRPLPAELDDLAGRRFELLIPFGCEGPSPPESIAALRWEYSLEEQTLRVNVAPTRWRAADWGLNASEGPGSGGGEGFWITRPWTSSESCPPQRGSALAADAQPITLPGQTLAIAQFTPASPDPDQARTFDLVKRIALERSGPDQGFRVRLTGRIQARPFGTPVRCRQPAGAEQRPICVVTASFEELSVEMAASGEVLGTWPLSRQVSP